MHMNGVSPVFAATRRRSSLAVPGTIIRATTTPSIGEMVSRLNRAMKKEAPRLPTIIGALSAVLASCVGKFARSQRKPSVAIEGHAASTRLDLAPSRAFVRPRSSPQLESDGQRVDADRGPPRGFIAIGVQLPVMEPADGDGVFVADFSAERTRLGEANVMRLGGRPAADDAGLRGDELAVFFVAQANGFPHNASAT